MTYNEMIGKQFGYLKVIGETAPRFTGKQNYLKRRMLCLCCCGEYFVTYADHIRNGSVQSCGCFRRESVKKRKEKSNIFDLSKEYGIGYTNQNVEFYFDLDDYNLIKDFCWHENTYGYIVATTQDKRVIFMHRLIMGMEQDNENKGIIDHINHQKTDNRKANLRIVTNTQNHMNRTKKSPEVGVAQIGKKWVARIGFNKRNIHLGMFSTKEDAIAARKAAEEKYFGEYSYDASLKIAERNKIK